MDRDIALQITQKITEINTALQTLVTNTAPTASNRGVDETRSIEESETGPDIEPIKTEPVEPENRNKK